MPPYWYTGKEPAPPIGLKNVQYIPVLGIYDVDKDGIVDDPFPSRMSWLADYAAEPFMKMQERFTKEGLKLVLSDLFRTYAVQADLYKRKPTLAKPPGNSYHEAGAAYDFSVNEFGERLLDAYKIMDEFGWYGLRSVQAKIDECRNKKITLVDLKKTPECWHRQRTKEIGQNVKFPGGITAAIAYIGNNKA
jgi:D-alanyl-D-alanine dipeptidase